MAISISRQLNYYLRLNNLSANAFAEKSGVSKAYLNDLVNGKMKNPGIQKVEQIADGFEITVQRFLTPFEELEEIELLVERIELLPVSDRKVIENMVDALESKN